MDIGQPQPKARGWEAIRAEVQRRIHDRIWLPGAMIPTEEALAVEFSCARATVNRALRELAESGVLERRRKTGTRVAALPVRRAVLDIAVIRREVEALGASYAFRLLQRHQTTPPDPVRDRLGLAANAKWLFVETLHLADGAPFALETRWLDPAVLGETPPDFKEISVNEWLVGNVPYKAARISFYAAPARPREAGILNVKLGTALLITERETAQETSPITLVRLAHLPGYRVETTL